MTTFNKGDICIGKDFTRDTKYNGAECEIIGGLRSVPWHNKELTGYEPCYLVRWTFEGDVQSDVQAVSPKNLSLKASEAA